MLLRISSCSRKLKKALSRRSSDRFAFVAPDYTHRADIAGTIPLNPSKRENIHCSSHVRNPNRSARLDRLLQSAWMPASGRRSVLQHRRRRRGAPFAKSFFHLFLLRKQIENHACCLLVQAARKSAQFSPDKTLATTREKYSAEMAAHCEALPENGAGGSEVCQFLTVSTSSLQR